MVAFRQKFLYSGKVVVLGQIWFYPGRSGSIRAKLVVFGQSCCIRAKAVLFGRKWLHLGKVVVFRQKLF